MALPPSGEMTEPVIKEDASVERKYTVSATSAGVPPRIKGVSSKKASLSSSESAEFIFVSIKPGATALTLMPEGPHSFASALVYPITPAFAAEYALSIDAPVIPQIEEIFTMTPD